MRITDLDNLLEFAPPQAEIDPNAPPVEAEPETTEAEPTAEPEAIVAEPVAEPTPVAEPVAQAPAAPTATPLAEPAPVAEPVEEGNTSGDHLLSLIRKTQYAPKDHPLKKWVNNILQKLDIPVPKAIAEATKSKSSTTNRALSQGVVVATTNALIERIRKLNPEQAAEFEQALREADEKFGPIFNEPEVRKALTAAIKGIQLNAEGEILFKNRQIRDLADAKADALGMEKKWARNLIGMFDLTISPEDQKIFLEHCNNGTALRIAPNPDAEGGGPTMLDLKSGTLDQVVTDHPPNVREVFKSIKGTLLDISLSTGQGAATGPFEAMLCIMGNARKAGADEGGDIVVPVNGEDKKFEVKSCSITDKSGFGYTQGWMDAPAPIPPAGIKAMFVESLGSRTMVAGSDFTKSGLPAMRETFKKIRDPGTELQILITFHATVFANVSNIVGYDYKIACAKILKYIKESAKGSEKHAEIAKEHATMAMLEYMNGKGNDGFIFYNSSFQQFRVIYGIKEMLDCAKNFQNFGLTAITPLKMQSGGAGTTRRGTPGVYFGPSLDSDEGKAYKDKIKKDPQWINQQAMAKQRKKLASLEKQDPKNS